MTPPGRGAHSGTHARSRATRNVTPSPKTKGPTVDEGDNKTNVPAVPAL